MITVAFLASQRAQARVRVFMLGVVACSLVGCSNGKGLRQIPDASADLRADVPDASIGCACASGIFPACPCATPDGANRMAADSAVESDSASRMDTTPDGADTMVVDSAVESDSASRMDTTPDSPDSRAVDSAVESDGAASIDTAGTLSCHDLSVAALNGLLQVVDDSCQSDADCTTVIIANKCIQGCWLIVNVNTVAALEAAEDQLCQPFFAQKCTLLQPPCPAFVPPTCVVGTCREWP